MRDYTLSNKKTAELERLHRSLRDKRQADRVKAVLALSKGWSPAQVAKFFFLTKRPPVIISSIISKAAAGPY